MSADGLSHLTARLSALAEEDVAVHPDVLEAVHRALVDELDALATTVSSGG